MRDMKSSQAIRLAPGRLVLLSLGLFVLSVAPVSIFAQTQADTQSSTQSVPDNSGTNKVQDQGKTADQQPNDHSDIDTTAKIRRMVIADKSISTYGHNVKIIVRHGAVTLKGPVHSEQEKQSIDQMAAQVVGQDKVTDHMTVK